MTTHIRFVSLARVATALTLPRIAAWERAEDAADTLDRLDARQARITALEARVDRVIGLEIAREVSTICTLSRLASSLGAE